MECIRLVSHWFVTASHGIASWQLYQCHPFRYTSQKRVDSRHWIRIHISLVLYWLSIIPAWSLKQTKTCIEQTFAPMAVRCYMWLMFSYVQLAVNLVWTVQFATTNFIIRMNATRTIFLRACFIHFWFQLPSCTNTGWTWFPPGWIPKTRVSFNRQFVTAGPRATRNEQNNLNWYPKNAGHGDLHGQYMQPLPSHWIECIFRTMSVENICLIACVKSHFGMPCFGCFKMRDVLDRILLVKFPSHVVRNCPNNF